MTRYQINLTDHAFWLGSGCIDKCVEFREYGAKVSNEYRDISKEIIVIVPFYPVLHRDREFQGLPFKISPEQKIVFSGGALYKTNGADGLYYKMIAHILESHVNVIFWYAGNGNDSQMKDLIQKFPGRVFHTDERSDLFQVLEHCRVYLSTYPLCGGLMFQYAAKAGCVPVTLKSSEVSDGFLIDQKNINVEFNDLNMLYAEVDKLICDDEYAYRRSIQMKKSVISEDIFDNEVSKLVKGLHSDSFQTNFEHINTSKLREWYISVLNKSDICKIFLRRNALKMSIHHYPYEFLVGGFSIFCSRLKK